MDRKRGPRISEGRGHQTPEPRDGVLLCLGCGEGLRPFSVKEDPFLISAPYAFGLTLIVGIICDGAGMGPPAGVEVGMMEGFRQKRLKERKHERKKWALVLLNCH